MQIVGIVFLIIGILQVAGAISGSRLYQALPHFQRSKRLFGPATAVKFHVVFGLVGALIGWMVLARVIALPLPK